jgi:hypothetical protein
VVKTGEVLPPKVHGWALEFAYRKEITINKIILFMGLVLMINNYFLFYYLVIVNSYFQKINSRIEI